MMRLVTIMILIAVSLCCALEYDWSILGATDPLCALGKFEVGERINLYGDPEGLDGGYLRPNVALETFGISWAPSVTLEYGPLNIISLKAKAVHNIQLIDSELFTNRADVDLGNNYTRLVGRAGLILPLMPVFADGGFSYQWIETGRHSKQYDEFTDLVVAGPQAQEWGWEGRLVVNVWDNFLPGITAQAWHDTENTEEKAEQLGGCCFYSFGKLPQADGMVGVIIGSYRNAVSDWRMQTVFLINFWGPF